MDNFKLVAKPALIFDFDGTMVKLFKNYNLKSASVVIKERILKYGVCFSEERDPFDAFSVITEQLGAGEYRTNAYIEADAVLKKTELEAIDTGEPVVGIQESFPQLCGEYKVGISTNNSVECVSAFIRKYWPQLNVPIVGRVAERPELMKPNNWSLVTVMKLIGGVPKTTVFVGDTARDYECAVSTSCRFIGMAHSLYKYERLKELISSDDIVCDYVELQDKLKL